MVSRSPGDSESRRDLSVELLLCAEGDKVHQQVTAISFLLITPKIAQSTKTSISFFCHYYLIVNQTSFYLTFLSGTLENY